jgi:hypothetical protein
MKDWYSAKELAGIKGMPGTVQGVIMKARKENWQSRPRQGKGGGREYHISKLPDETRAALLASAATLPATDPAADLESFLATRAYPFPPVNSSTRPPGASSPARRHTSRVRHTRAASASSAPSPRNTASVRSPSGGG